MPDNRYAIDLIHYLSQWLIMEHWYHALIDLFNDNPGRQIYHILFRNVCLYYEMKP